MRKIILNVFLILTLTSCSTAKLGYSFGDWLIKREILSYVKLYQGQQKDLELILDQYMLWHKKEMLPKYLIALNRLKLLLKEDTTVTNIKEIEAILLSEIMETISKLGHDIAPVLSSINDRQLDRSRNLLSKAFDKKIKKNKSYRSKDVYLLWKDNSIDWFGSLNSKQELWLNENIENLYTQKDSTVKMAITGKRQQSFLEIFDGESPEVRLIKQNEFWTNLASSYKTFEGRPHSKELLIEYLKLVDDKQKDNVIRELDKIASKIKSLM